MTQVRRFRSPAAALVVSLSFCLACGDAQNEDSSTTTTQSEVGSEEDSTSTTGTPALSPVVFVNFDGLRLSAGPADAGANTTDAAMMADRDLAPYNTGPARAAVFAAVQQDWAGFDITITDQRPSSGDYSMVVVTDTNPFGTFVDSVGSVDCGDAEHRDVNFAFAQFDWSAGQMAALVSRMIGHSFGLEGVVPGSGDLMESAYSVDDPSLVDQCLGLEFELQCAAEHAEHCTSGQNGRAEILARFGPG